MVASGDWLPGQLWPRRLRPCWGSPCLQNQPIFTVSRLKQSLCLPPFIECGASRRSLIETAAAAGYAGIDLWGRDEDFEQTVAMAREHGLVVASMVGHWTHEAGLNDPANHPRIEDELSESITIAAEHGIPGVITLSGNLRPGVGVEESVEITVEGLRRVLPLAAEKGINLNLELLNSKVDHPGYEADNSAWGVMVCERADHPRCRLLYDIYHMQIMEGDIIRTIREVIAHIGHFHTAGVPGRREIGACQELNYAAIAAAIVETGYDGFVAHEFWPEGEPLAAVAEAFAVCA